MPNRSSKPKLPTDVNQRAKAIVDHLTRDREAERADVTNGQAEPEKDPAAVALGRRGGLKGGPARAKKLSKKKRTEIAKKAAQARWAKP
jgi:hypothetical protein